MDRILWPIGLVLIVAAFVFGFLMWLDWWLPQVVGR